MSEKEMLFLVLQLHDCLPKTQNRPLSFIFMNLIINIAYFLKSFMINSNQTTVKLLKYCSWKYSEYFKSIYRFKPKKARGSIWAPCGFSKNAFSKKRKKPWLIPVIQKIWRRPSLSILAIFIDFRQFVGLFDISLLQRN